MAESVRWMRERISNAMTQLVDGSDASELLYDLREDCNAYLDVARDEPGLGLRPSARRALEQLRGRLAGALTAFNAAGVGPAGRLADRIAAAPSNSGIGDHVRTIYVPPADQACD